MKKELKLIALFVAGYLGINLNAQTPVYFNIVSHNEISDPLKYASDSSDFFYIRPLIKELCDTIISKHAKYNMQVDGNFINGVLKWENGAVNDNDILEWANNSEFIDIDPHNHYNPLPNHPNNVYNPYKYPDLMKLLDSCGATYNHIVLGGVTYADTTVGNVTLHENWTVYLTPTPGVTFTNYFINADIVWGTASPGHVADYTHFGVWKPAGGSSPTEFGMHDPNNSITHIGGGCKEDIGYHIVNFQTGELNQTTDEVISKIRSIVDNIQTLPPSPNDFYTMNMLINFRDIPQIPNFADSIGVIIDGLQPYVNQGKIVWATIGEKYDLWYAMHPDPNDYFNYDCNDLVLGVEDYEKNDFAVYPNPATNEVHLENLPQKSSIYIYSQFGELVYQKDDFNQNVIDVSGYRSGLYFIVIKNNNVSVTQKIVKIHE